MSKSEKCTSPPVDELLVVELPVVEVWLLRAKSLFWNLV